MNRLACLGVSGLALIAAAPAALAQWTVTNLHPAGARDSHAYDVWGGQQVGDAVIPPDRWASLWTGSAASWVGLTDPFGSLGSGVALGVYDGCQVGDGYWGAVRWCEPGSGQLLPKPPEMFEAYVWDTNGVQHAGWARRQFGSANAILWTGGTPLSLHPASYHQSTLFGLSDSGQQVGAVKVDAGSPWSAMLWSGSVASRVKLDPLGSTASVAYAVHDGQQVGYAEFGGGPRASLWTGSSTSWLDLTPAGSASAEARGVHAGWQVGWAEVGGLNQASLWNGTAASWEDLSLALPGAWRETYAHSIWSDATTIYIAGYGRNLDSGVIHDEALLWTRPIAAVAPVYLSGVVAYGANPSGASITEPGEYDNILGTGNDPVTINGSARGTVFALPVGVHDFTFTGVGGLYNALSLYLSDNGDPFSRPFASAPDLAVYGMETPLVPAAGVTVQTNGQFSGLAAYSGAARFDVGGLTVRVTGYTFSSGSGSGTFELTVTERCYADCDDSGALDFFDFLCFQNQFAAADPRADCDGSGALDFFDFLCFQNAFAAGCP